MLPSGGDGGGVGAWGVLPLQEDPCSAVWRAAGSNLGRLAALQLSLLPGLLDVVELLLDVGQLLGGGRSPAGILDGHAKTGEPLLVLLGYKSDTLMLVHLENI